MSQLVSKGHHIIHLVQVALKQNWVSIRRVVRAERPAHLALSRLGINPVLVKKLGPLFRHIRRERPKRLENDRLRSVPSDLFLSRKQRRVAIDVRQFI